MLRMTSPARRPRDDESGASTTRRPSEVPKYSARPGFTLTSSRSASASLMPASARILTRPPGPSNGVYWILGISPDQPGIASRNRWTITSASDSPAWKVTVRGRLSRRSSSRTVSPSSSREAISMRRIPGRDCSSGLSACPARAARRVPLIRTTMSPVRTLAWSAGPFGVTPATRAPMESRAASAVRSTRIPRRPRRWNILPISPESNENVNARWRSYCCGGSGWRGGCGGRSCAAAATATADSTVRVSAAIFELCRPIVCTPSRLETGVRHVRRVHVDERREDARPLVPQLRLPPGVVLPLCRIAQPGVDRLELPLQVHHHPGHRPVERAGVGVRSLQHLLHRLRALHRGAEGRLRLERGGLRPLYRHQQQT